MRIAAAKSAAISGILQLHLQIVRVLEIQFLYAVAIPDSGFDAVFFEHGAGAFDTAIDS